MFILLYSIFVFIVAIFVKAISKNKLIKFSNLILVLIFACSAFSAPSNSIVIGLLIFSIYANFAYVSFRTNDGLSLLLGKILKK